MSRLGVNTKFVFCFALLLYLPFGAIGINPEMEEKVSAYLEEISKEADIPGMSIVLLQGEHEKILNYGFANVESGQKVGEQTLFQIASCSKAFTALALSILESEGKVNLDAKVSDYLPWFKVFYEEEETKEYRDTSISLIHLLHHTSGIAWESISDIPQSNAPDALEQTVRKLVGKALDHKPGVAYEYATVNYDVLALVIERITQQSFESYIQEKVFTPLQLNHTSIGISQDSTRLAQGYKIGFFQAHPFDAPIFKGNNAAGYIISNSMDISRWLKFQMGMLVSEYTDLLPILHKRDETVPLHGMAAYARGWEIALDGTGEIYHHGHNPNFTSYFVFRPEEKIAVAILANSNSTYTPVIGNKLMKILASEKILHEFDPGDRGDASYTIISIVLGLFMLIVLSLIVLTLLDIRKKKRSFEKMTQADFLRFAKGIVFVLPFLFGLYFLPKAVAGFSWEAMLVWTPFSFYVMTICMLGAIGISYLAYFISLLFPEQNLYKRKAPQIILISILSGLSNMIVIILVTSSLGADVNLLHLVFYYGLAISLYLFGRKFVQTHLIQFTRSLVYDLRIQLIDKIFTTSYQNFEKMDRGRVYTALNDDVNMLGQSTNLVVTLITSLITAIGAFLYLASIAFWATCLTIFLIVSLAAIYSYVGQRTNVYFEQARDEQNVFMRLINGLIDGYKELSLQLGKKTEYKADIAESAEALKNKMATADIRFLNAFLVGESLLVVLLGFVAMGMPVIFTDIPLYIIMSFVIVLLYLIGPINGILGAVPAIMQIKIAWNRVNSFIHEIPDTLKLTSEDMQLQSPVNSLRAEGVYFRYHAEEGEESFSVGPLDLEAHRGEITFIIGGNGSGKTTFSKLLTGLYKADEGTFLINEEEVSSAELGEYFSTAFSPPFLFEKLYNIDLSQKQFETQEYLKLLGLEDKVEIDHEKYNTINLSTGQRKRLALLQCYLENRPIYLFDEWAADQDPEFRKFFYQTLLPEMKEQGKIVIAITHDDHYFHIADRVLKMKQGKLEQYHSQLA